MMATKKEIEAAKERYIASGKFMFSWPSELESEANDLLLLADAFIAQKSQPVNERLLKSAKAVLSQCEKVTPEVHALVESIAAAEAEIVERALPVTEEMLLGVGFKKNDIGWFDYFFKDARNRTAFVSVWDDDQCNRFARVGMSDFSATTRGDVLDLLSGRWKMKHIESTEAEITERLTPVTEEWLISIGFKHENKLSFPTPVSFEVTLRIPSSCGFQDCVLLDWSAGYWNLNNRRLRTGTMATRGDVLDLLRVLGNGKGNKQ